MCAHVYFCASVICMLICKCIHILTALSRSSDLAERLRRRGILLAAVGRVTTTGVERGDELVDLKIQ